MPDKIGIPTEDGFYCLDSNWRFTFVNRITLEFLKRKPEELTGKIIWEEYPKLIGTTFERICKSVLEKRSAQRIEMQGPKSGTWYHIVVFPAQGGVAVYWRDITAEKRKNEALASNEQRFRALTMATSELTYRMNSDCSELTVLSGSGIFKYASGSYKNWLQDYIPPEEHDRITAANRKAINDKSIFEMEHKAYLSDGSVGWVYTRSVPILDDKGDIGEWFGAVNNITERKEIEKKLKESQTNLETLVEKLKRADENRNYFINTLSHELRNPLAAITMGFMVLKGEPKGSEQAEKTISIMERQAEQLSRLVDDLLDMTRITQNKIELKKQRMDLNDVVYHIVTDFQPQFSEKGVKLDFALNPDPVYIDADPVRLTQAIGNLLHNAAKFTRKGDKAKVSVCPDKNNEEQVLITVQDTGAGIDPLFQPRIFEPFAQADSSLAHSLGGLGLGLPIVKGVVDLHNGSIDVLSEGTGKGTRFVIRLPLSDDNDSASKENRQAEAADQQTYSLRILIIEDIPDLAEIISELLFHLGHEVIVALNGPDGVRKAKIYHPDVLISDIGLPEMSGYEIAEAFQNDSQLKDIYLIALSGYAQPEDVERSRKAGFRNHLAKPVNLENLKAALNKAYSFISK